MPITPQDPIPGRNGRAPQWNYCAPANGTALYGFMAGKPYGVYCHNPGGQSKPCRAMISGGELACAFCTQEAPVWRGFTPWYGALYSRYFCCVTEDLNEAVREIEVGQQIKLTRGKSKRACVEIRAENWRTLPIPPSDERPAVVDLLPSLLKCWKDLELQRWHAEGATRAAPATADVPSAVAARAGVRLTPQEEVALIRDCLPVRGGDGARGGAPELVGDVLSRVPGANGKHKPKPK